MVLPPQPLTSFLIISKRLPSNPSTDVRDAMVYLRQHAAELGIDPDRMCTFGFSIGTAPWHLWAAMKDR